jgi:hypothetical protein
MTQREQGSVLDEAVARFDYDAAAELFPTRGRKHRAMSYRRFARAADAVRFAIEDMQPHQLLGAYLEVNEKRFDSHGIRQLYDNERYPLPRAASCAAA